VALGVPETCPVDVLNVAQLGAFRMLNVRARLAESVALGVNVYVAPTLTDVGGWPEIVGGDSRCRYCQVDAVAPRAATQPIKPRTAA
jgi:hypothetical protein